MKYLKQSLAISFITILLSLSVALGIAAQETSCETDTDYLELGQALLNNAEYAPAIEVFTCAIATNPRSLGAYRGRIEALLLSGAYSDAMLDYASIKTTIVPSIPDAIEQILNFYQTALDSEPENIQLLTGYSFAQWYNFDPEGALITLDRILVLEPDNLYGLVLHGNTEFFLGNVEAGEDNFARALDLSPESADIYFIIADGYLYALGELELALDAVTIAAELGLDTPRTDAIFATIYFYLDDVETALPFYARHIERTTTESIAAGTLEQGQMLILSIIPAQSYTFTLEVEANETLIITAMSDIDDVSAMGEMNEVDTIILLLAPDGTIIIGNDDNIGLNAGFEFTVSEAGTYTLLLSSFEGAGFGEVLISRE